MNLLKKMVFGVGIGLAATGLVKAAEELPQTVDEKVPPQSDNYALTSDSKPQPGIVAGRFIEFALNDSKIFPGTQRRIQVYVPAGYRGKKEEPACLMVFPDGIGFHATAVFDNLIARHELPLIIAVGVTPGVVSSPLSEANPRFDRSFELDSMTDRFPRFILEEVLPAVEGRTTPDGRSIYLSQNADDRGVAGSSTGAIAAFNLAWQRPESFHRVFTSIGTFVGMRGGERYYVLVRKTEPKPLRIFMEDGAHDVCIPAIGDWWMSNQTMERALEWSGYATSHAWGAGTHNGAHAAAIFPDAMRWLWKGWPAPVVAGPPGNHIFREILLKNEGWSAVAPIARAGQYPKVSRLGVVSLGDALAAVPAGGQVARSQFAGLHVRASTVRSDGDVYFTIGGPPGDDELWLARKSGERVLLDRHIKGAGGLAFSPDEQWLFVAQSLSRWSLSYRVLKDGTLDGREPFYEVWVPDWEDDSGAAGVCFDTQGYAYVATRVGVQVIDRNGRVLAIIPLPGNQPATGLCFGGENFDILFVASPSQLYSRRLHVKGMPVGAPPITLPKWAPG